MKPKSEVLVTRNKSGRELAEEYMRRAEDWKRQIETSGTVHEYAYAGRVKRREFARECDFSYSVCTQNEGVRALLQRCDREWYGTEAADKAASSTAVERADKHARSTSSDNSRLMTRVAELEAENRALRQQLASYRELESVVQGGMAGFGVNG